MNPVPSKPVDRTMEADRSATIATPSTWECFAAAVQFLTRLPVAGAIGAVPGDYDLTLRRAVLFFPLVGGLIGLLTASVFLLAAMAFSPLLAALLAVGFEALLTGALHEDALADTCDAFGGGWSRAQTLEIMKDSRLGSYGAMGLMIGVGLRVTAVASLAEPSWWWAGLSIVAAAALGRIGIVAMIVSTPPLAGRPSAAQCVSAAQTWRVLLIGSLIALPTWAMWCALRPAVAAVSIVTAALVWLGYRQMVLRRVGGTTGDLLGCSAFAVQLVVLIGASYRG